MMSDIIIVNSSDISNMKHKNSHSDYEYYKKDIAYGEQYRVSIYRIPPQKSAYPYHYHHKNEEVFYIISGKGLLRTPKGNRSVSAGDIMCFPSNEKGSHKLTNCSETQELVYLDFGTYHDIDVAVYPDSKKIGIWGKDINQIYRCEDNADYYLDE